MVTHGIKIADSNIANSAKNVHRLDTDLTTDNNINHLHDETNILHIDDNMRHHASQPRFESHVDRASSEQTDVTTSVSPVHETDDNIPDTNEDTIKTALELSHGTIAKVHLTH